MPTTAIFSFAGAYFSILVGAFVLARDRNSFVHRIFALGMILLAVEATLRGIGYRAILPEDVLFWQRLRLIVWTFLPGTWLIFSLTYSRANYGEFLQRWKWVVSAAFAAPLILVTIFWDSFFVAAPILGPAANWTFRLGWSGWAFYLTVLLSAVLILANLERTLRQSTGRMRWQIKFMVFGVGSLFALQIYISSQIILFYALNTGLGLIHAVALLVANILFLCSLVRAQFLNVNFYVSRVTLHNSLTFFIVGAYLLSVGFLAQLVRYYNRYYNREHPLPLDAFLIFLALTGLAILLFSDRLRRRIKHFVSRHFNRPQYDYRKEWMALSQRTALLVDAHELSAAVAKMVSETLDTLSVNIWVLDDTQTRFALTGSTVFSRSEAKALEKISKGIPELVNALQEQSAPVDFREGKFDWPAEIMLAKPDYYRDSKITCAVPLRAGGGLLGLMTLNDDRIGGEPLSEEDLELLQTFAVQLAASLLNLKLGERLQSAKETEAFQNVSAFFIHDLKNLASRLSLTVQNFPLHFDKPEFRADALRVISQSVDKMGEMCNRLSPLRQKVDLKLVETNLNDLVISALEYLQSSIKVPLEKDLQPVPKTLVDPEEMNKVLTNLLLNATEAVNGGGKIRVMTSLQDKHIILSVSDNGCGMSEEFIAQSLFKPFKTTKRQGLGIGLFHSKLIVEAHRGKLEVESEEGKGTVFRVVLPARQ